MSNELKDVTFVFLYLTELLCGKGQCVRPREYSGLLVERLTEVSKAHDSVDEFIQRFGLDVNPYDLELIFETRAEGKAQKAAVVGLAYKTALACIGLFNATDQTS